MEILKNVINIGIEKPFTFLHISDIHLAEADETETAERREFAAGRKACFALALENLEFVKEYVKKNGYPLFNTGDMLDFITPANLRIARDFARETGMIMVAGNHEYWHCENNRFSFDDVFATYAAKNEALKEVDAYFDNDIRLTCIEINGVNMVILDDSDYHISEEHFEALKKVEEQGKPIILFMHIPLFSELHGPEAKYSLAAPQKYFENCHPVDVFERTPDMVTVEACEHIINSPLIKCVIAGHTHLNTEIPGDNEKFQIITGVNTIREITVV